MDPVLGEVRHQDDGSTWRATGLPPTACEPVRASPVEQNQCRLQREDRQHLDQQGVDEEVGQVDHPLPPEHRLPRAQGEQPLERNEDRRIKKEIQDEEIERQPGGATFRRRRYAPEPPSSAAASVKPSPVNANVLFARRKALTLPKRKAVTSATWMTARRYGDA